MHRSCHARGHVHRPQQQLQQAARALTAALCSCALAEELLEKERFITNGRPIMLDRLTQWEDSKISNAEMMAEIEKLIQKKQIDPRWLHDGNAVAESNFIKLDPSDHADHAAAAVPDPCAGIKDCVVAPPAGAAAQSEAHREP